MIGAPEEIQTPDLQIRSLYRVFDFARSCWKSTPARRPNTMRCNWPPRRRSSLQRLSLCPRRSPPLPILESYQTRHQVLGVLQSDQPEGRSAPPTVALEPPTKEGPVHERRYHKIKPAVTETLKYGESDNHEGALGPSPGRQARASRPRRGLAD
jgi:hypothetical protein